MVAAMRTASCTLSSLIPLSVTLFSCSCTHASQPLIALTASENSSKCRCEDLGRTFRFMRSRTGFAK
jgi:hypothetical protein